MVTQVKAGSSAANAIFNAALFSESVRSSTFINLMTDGAPKVVDSNKLDPRKQTGQGAAIVRIQDLAKTKGEAVTMDLYHQLGGELTMGDDPIEGKEESLTSAQFPIAINQYRKAVSSGGKMTAQRTSQDLVAIANQMLGSYHGSARDQLALVHLAGARGDVGPSRGDWVLPLSGTSLTKQLVNPITPPTYDRHLFGGDATALDNVDSADVFDLRVVNRLRLAVGEAAIKVQPLRYENDPAKDDEPFYCLFITERQWYDWENSTDANFGGMALRKLQGNAVTRAGVFNSPLFKGGAALFQNILIRKMSRSIVFNPGSTVSVCTNVADATESNLTAGTKINRAIMLGGQALGDAWGMSGAADKGGYHFSQVTKPRDYDNDMGHAIAWMNGMAKVRFKMSDGRVNDHGIYVVDTAVSG